jgi:CRISPR-associated exonuclease Cas4
MWNDDDLIPISALQHALFCMRQFALIHLEGAWAENLWTAEGRVLHERVHRERHESRKLFREEYGMAVRSPELGITGKCDLVEIRFDGGGNVENVNPVEFKRGREKSADVDRVQLCAQALCLEEMFGVYIACGQMYYFKEHRRKDVICDDPLREKTKLLIADVRKIITARKTPPAVYEKQKCDRCSLIEICMPKIKKNVSRYVTSQILDAV